MIKCENIVSCLMQNSKKYGKWPEAYVLILHSYWSPQFRNFAIPPIWLSHSTTWKYCSPCYCFLTPQFRTFMNLLIGIFWVSNLTKFSLKIDRNYAPILITIISNITVLVSHNVICFRFYMPISHYVNKKLLQLIVCIVV